MRRRSLKFVVLAIVATASLAVWASVGMAGNNVGQFEIDGNTPDDTGAGDPIDWGSTPAPPNLTQFTDDPLDTQFGGGSKWDDQSSWSCNTGAVNSKSDILNGAISFRKIGTDQFVYVNFNRADSGGSVNIDYEFNQNSAPTATCPALPQRTVGDIVIAFERNGNNPLGVRVLQWTGAGFNSLPVGAMGVTWDAAVSAGDTFGEASLNISAILGREIACGDFASVHMDSRNAPTPNAGMQDRTLATSLNFASCPGSTVKKEVRTLPSGSFAESTNASPNDTVEYRFSYTNTGTGQASNVVVTDELPAGTTFVSGSGCSLGGDGVTITCSFGNVAGGGTASGTFQVKLPGSFPQVNNTITNVASVSSTGEAPKDSNPATVNVTANPKSELTKSAKNERTGQTGTNISAIPGDSVTYTFTYTNTGSSPAHNVTITDTVKTGTSFVSGSGCTNNSGTVTCSLGTVNPNDPKTVSFTVKLDASFGEGQTAINNTASVDTTEENPTNSNQTTVNVTAAPTVTLLKSASTEGPVGVGDQITYTLAYANSGNAPATNQVINEPIPAGTKFVSCTGGCTTTPPAPPGDPADVTNASWNIGTIPANNTGNGSVTITVEVLAGAGEQICNTATIGAPQATPVSSNQVCIGGEDVRSTLAKTAKNETTGETGTDISASPGDKVTYTFTYKNEGTTAAHNVVITDEIQDHTTFDSGTGCTHDEGIVTCNLGTVAGGATATASFTVLLDSSFPAGETTINNTATVVTDEDGPTDSPPTTVTVTAAPDLSVTKTTNQSVVAAGGQITYTLVYANEGNADATNVTITEATPVGTKWVSCNPTCTQTGTPPNVTSVSWNVGTVEGGDGGSLTYVVEVLDTVGCTVCNIATIASIDQDGPDSDTAGGDPISSNQLCIGSNPGPRPAGANANGTATGLHLEQALLGINTTLPANADGGPPKTSVDSSQSGIGTDGEDRSVLTVNVPNPTGVLAKVQAVRASTVSTVSGAPAKAGTLSVAETAGVNLLNGVVTADLVRAVAGAEATGESARNDSGPSGGSSFVNLKVLGKAVKANVAPGTTIDLPDLVFGNDSYVKLMEVNNSTSRPGPNEQSGGTYSADTTVTAIRVRISSPTRTDIIISQAKAHADFPQTQICEAMRRQSVSGHAYTASEITNPPILPALVGFVQIPASGGFAHQQLAEASIGEPNYVVLAKATETHSLGVLNPASSDALSYAAAADVCVLRLSPTSCLIQSGLVRSQANSRATSAGASSHDTGTTLATLVVAGVRLPVNVPRNTVIPLAGLGFVVLNEQFCDNGATLPSCAGATSTGLTVRSVRVVVTVPSNPFGIAAGAQIIVNEAHSDASFVP